jgi:FkbM family methyltransferase
MSIRDGLKWSYRTAGIQGVLTLSAYRLFGRPKEITARPPGFRNRVHLRIGTTDHLAYAQVLLGREYEFDLPFSPKAIVDAGANIGMTSIYFTHRFPDAKIIAIEAEASNFAVLARNVRPYPSIIPIHGALWNRDGEISVSQPDPTTGSGGEWAFVVHEGSGGKVRAITMPTLMKEMQISSVDLLKVDIEGAEKEVFEASDWMDDIHCLMIELHDRFRPGCSEAVDSVAQQYSKLQRGETTVYLRKT